MADKKHKNKRDAYPDFRYREVIGYYDGDFFSLEETRLKGDQYQRRSQEYWQGGGLLS